MQTAESQNEKSKIEPVFDEDDVPTGKLDDAEIARLVSLSSQASYNRTDNIPVKPKESFEPRTLVTIAMEAQRSRDAEKLASTKQEVQSEAVSGDAEAVDDADNIAKELSLGDGSAITGTTDSTTNEGVSSQETSEAVADEAELNEEEIVAAAALEKLNNEYERGLAEGRAIGEEAGYKAGQDKGYEAGRAAGQAEATAQLETAIQGFEKATLALASSAALDIDRLTASIHDAILLMASERAGIAITEMPAEFATRIESILATIKRGTDHPQISLNPEDLLALKPIITTREKLKRCRLDADDSLAHGDLKLVIDGVGIEDELHRRVSRKSAVLQADESFEERSTPALDPRTDTAKIATTEPTAAAELGPASVTDTVNDTTGEISTMPDAKVEREFSIGFKPKTKLDDATVPVIEAENKTGADES